MNENIFSESSESSNILPETIKKIPQHQKPVKKQYYDNSLLEITVSIKNTWFDILDDIFSGNLSVKTFVKTDRLFHVGITLFVLTILLYLYDYLFSSMTQNNGSGVLEIRHVYEPQKQFQNLANPV